jgi:hypothetical protein
MRALCVGAVLLAVAAGAPRASAEFFQYSTTVNFTSPSYPNTPNPVTISITPLTSDVNQENFDARDPGTDIVLGNITVNNLNHNFTGTGEISIPYTFTLTISDFPNFGPPGNVGSPNNLIFTIAGTLTGSIGAGNKVNIFTTPTITSTNPQTVGTETYTLALNPFVPPGPSFAGTFGLHVLAQPANIPEPTTISLLGLGCLALAIPAWRRRRNKPAVSG